MANSSSSATVNLPPPSPCCSSLPPNGGGDQLIILRRGRHQMGTLPTAAADGSRGRQATGQQRLDSKQQPNSFRSTKTAANRSTGSRSRSRVPMCFLSLAIGCRLSVLFLLLLCLAQCPDWANSRPTEPSGPIPVGGIFTMDIEAGEAAPKLPTWIKASQDGQQLFGIPQQKDLGQHNIQLTKGRNRQLEVAEDRTTACGPDRSTIWLEIFDTRLMSQLSIEDQFKAAQTLLANLKDAGVRSDDIRLFPRSYLDRYRTVAETIHRLDQGSGGSKAQDQLVFVLNISCGELTEQASEVISAVAEDGLAFQVVEGELRKDRPRLTTTTSTAASTTSGQHTRTTRRVHNNNNRPIVLNPLKSFHCVRGILCRIPIDENTFMDAEDGQTSRLTLNVHATGNHSNFLAVVPGANMLEGVPMEEANDAFSFRLEARDRHNVANSAPFQVFLKPMAVPGRPSHRYSMILDTPLERFSAKPELLRDFVYKLSAALRRLPAEQRSQEWAEAAAQVHVEQLADNGASQTLLKWWNASLSRAICEEERVNITRDRMVHPGTDRLRHEFVKQMGAQFHVRKVSTELLGKCLTRHLLDQARIRVFTTTQRNPMLEDRHSSAWANQLLIPLILLVTILLLCTVLTLLCCAHHKRGKKGAGKRNEFTTKAGRPVVFPDEVPHRDESSSADGSLATVTTPMLVEREQPPLDPTKMTMHENPLYRPPPQVQAQLLVARNSGNDPMRPQQQQQSPPPPTLASTFSPPSSGQLKPIDASPTPLRANPFLREHPHQQSTRFHATPVGQRLPPPYVAH